ncbi:TPA: hypothetical protein KD853_000984 [Vibrio parahaemolyticus]|uniref:hypothetical protein n=1 Tax=Vibrio parahaemolyticus TaxID=670 RepID=UPI0004703380|nr:hypothetical protein [Vibrio parahaemolyticus]PWF67367.1 hypothetical protein CCD93_14470 [Vibrio sp. T21]EGR0288618.1 hypothetical protein [Vibrio parahaemolyticus]EGR0312148.1 hypothetical protein [Vibrio parahaemolyticus]EGR0744908.1 hypothetical protein [Vibrio parahaemolyticus]EGR1177192.1 hypothetical protein [Vibrio parahaemolyticus]
MTLLDSSFLTFFIAGGVAFLWFVIIGAIFIFFIPPKVKRFAFNPKHYSEVELALVSGFHFGALVHGVGLVAAVALPTLARRRGFADIHQVCSGLFIGLCRIYISVLLLLAMITFASMVVWMSIT